MSRLRVVGSVWVRAVLVAAVLVLVAEVGLGGGPPSCSAGSSVAPSAPGEPVPACPEPIPSSLP